MKLLRQSNIEVLMSALDRDEYDDELQDAAVGVPEIPADSLAFLRLYTAGLTPVLEIGCGSGGLFDHLPITHGVEPARTRYESAKRRGEERGIVVMQGVAEALPVEPDTFGAIVMINGLFQVRSDYETFLEVNRALRIGGHFVCNVLTHDQVDVVQGRCYGARNLARTLTQFGFEVIGLIEQDAGPRFAPYAQRAAYLAAVKVREFDPAWLCLPQVTDRSAIINFVPARDWRLL